MEEVENEGSLHVGNAEDSRVNALDSITYADHQQVFGQDVKTKEQPDDACKDDDSAGPAENVADKSEDLAELEDKDNADETKGNIHPEDDHGPVGFEDETPADERDVRKTFEEI